MARKPSDAIQYKIRIREDLRRRLEQAAKKRAVSINYEMTARLKESFDREEMFKLHSITSDLKIQWARWDRALFMKEQRGDLLDASEALVALLRKAPPDQQAVEKAATQVEVAIRAIKLHAEASARGPKGGDQ